MIKLYLIAITIFLLSGCSAPKPPVIEYKISTKSVNYSSSSEGCKRKSLKVSQAFSSNSLMSLKMSYVQGEHKIYSYSQAQWNNSPNQEISSALVKALRDSKLFRNTSSSKSRSRSDLILEINIEDFMQYFNKDLTTSHSNVVISLTLIDARSREVLATKTFSAKKEVQILDASGGVKGLDLALQEVLTEGLKFLNKACN